MRTGSKLEFDSINGSDDWRRAFPTEYAGLAIPLAVTRIQESQPQLLDRTTSCPRHAYLMGLNMSTMRSTVYVDGKKIQEGASHAGSMTIFHPGSTLRIITSGHVDACVMSLPIESLSAVVEDAGLRGGRQGEEIFRRVAFGRDPGLLILFKSLTDIGRISSPFDQMHADSLGMAIICELLSKYSSVGPGVTHLHRHGLSGLRLKRVEDFIHDNISQPISLSSLANAAGLSKMHFAAQFRNSTGMSPHNYVLQEKIRRAQQILSSTNTSLRQTGLDVGFLSHSHFSTAFKRIVGDTPARWRSDCNTASPIGFAGGDTAADAISGGRNSYLKSTDGPRSGCLHGSRKK